MNSDPEAAQNAPADAFARRAEQLVRSLSGIAEARVYDDGRGGIRIIDVTPRAGSTAVRTAHNVQSALLAAFGTAVDLDHIHVLTQDQGGEPESGDRRDNRNGNGNGNGNGAAAHAEAAPTIQEAEDPDRDPRDGPRLVSLDIVRHATGRVACIVVVVVDTDVRRASVEALDLPGAAEHAAAQAVVRAIGSGLQLDGVRHVDIAGLDYVVVAAREDLQGRRRAAAALVRRSAAHAAANAATRAARALLPAFTP